MRKKTQSILCPLAAVGFSNSNYHISNIDRLYALWQALNPGKWFETDIQGEFDQKIVGMGDVVTNQTPLRPFHKDEQGTVWTPDDARDWYQLGYTYPELKTGKETIAQILEMVNDAYGVDRKQALKMAETATELPKGMEIIDKEYGEEAEKNGVKSNDYALSIKYSKYDHPDI